MVNFLLLRVYDYNCWLRIAGDGSYLLNIPHPARAGKLTRRPPDLVYPPPPQQKRRGREKELHVTILPRPSHSRAKYFFCKYHNNVLYVCVCIEYVCICTWMYMCSCMHVVYITQYTYIDTQYTYIIIRLYKHTIHAMHTIYTQ